MGAGIAQWLERRTRDWKVAGSNPCWNGRRIFFSRVDFLCWLLFRYPFHPRVTTVARKKCRWQVTAKHAYTLRIEPCFGIGHNLSLICQMTSEDIKHQLNNNRRGKKVPFLFFTATKVSPGNWQQSNPTTNPTDGRKHPSPIPVSNNSLCNVWHMAVHNFPLTKPLPLNGLIKKQFTYYYATVCLHIIMPQYVYILLCHSMCHTVLSVVSDTFDIVCNMILDTRNWSVQKQLLFLLRAFMFWKWNRQTSFSVDEISAVLLTTG